MSEAVTERWPRLDSAQLCSSCSDARVDWMCIMIAGSAEVIWQRIRFGHDAWA